MKKIKILGIVIGVIVILVVTVMIILVVTVENTLNKEKGTAEVILHGLHSESKKAIIVFQPSFGGKTNTIASEIGRGLNESGFQVTINHPGKHLSTDLSMFDVIFFGSPVYAGQISGVLLEYMQKALFSDNAKIILFTTGLRSENELEIMEDLPLRNNLYDKVKFYATESGFVDAFNYGSGVILNNK